MSEKRGASRTYNMTPKGYRVLWATEAYKKRLEELKQLSDEEILKMAEHEGKE